VSCGKRGDFVAGDKSAPIAPNPSHTITAAAKTQHFLIETIRHLLFFDNENLIDD
jgi:hypothetical protein